MQQSRLGPSGVVALAIVTGLRWEAVAALPVTVVPTTLLVAQALSRAAAVGLMAMLPYLRGAGSRARPVVGRLPPLRLGVALAVGGGPLVLLPAPLRLGACVAAVAGLLSCAAWFSRKLGGYTGDCVGATQQCVELAVLLALLADVPG
jgi:adenosylcobinamide-GDP ribazoletransferase